jgi:hypothetical protein
MHAAAQRVALSEQSYLHPPLRRPVPAPLLASLDAPLVRPCCRRAARRGDFGARLAGIGSGRNRRRLRRQRDLEHLVDPLHRHDLELALDVVGISGEILFVVARDQHRS